MNESDISNPPKYNLTEIAIEPLFNNEYYVAVYNISQDLLNKKYYCINIEIAIKTVLELTKRYPNHKITMYDNLAKKVDNKEVEKLIRQYI
jgi:hypothetical protein